MTIKTWFLNKNFTQNERMVIESADMGGELEILKETEKAVFFQATSDWGTLKFWCPKSCLTENETKKERKERKERIISYQEIDGNYNVLRKNRRLFPIISYQEIDGNYNRGT